MRLFWRNTSFKPTPAPVPPAPLPPSENAPTVPKAVNKSPEWKKVLLLFLGLATIVAVTVLVLFQLCPLLCPLPACRAGRQPDCGEALDQDPCSCYCTRAAGCVMFFLIVVFYFDFIRREDCEDGAAAVAVQPGEKKPSVQAGPVV